jgi:acyl dehydratase
MNRPSEGMTVPRTVTESDVVTFACLTGDYSRMHMDRHYAEGLEYGGRVAHGLISASLAIGALALDAPHTVGRGDARAFVRTYDVNYRRPVLLGDTLHVRWQIVSGAPGPVGDPLTTAYRVENQRGDGVTDGTVLLDRSGLWQPETSVVPMSLPAQAPTCDGPRYLEDYAPGTYGGETMGRTMTEADIVSFAGLTGDWHPGYVDAEFAKRGLFGERVVPQMLCFNIGFAFWLRALIGAAPNTAFAGHVNDQWTFVRPVRIGDTVRCRYGALAVRKSRSRPGFGLITFALQLVDQHERLVQQGRAIMMYPTRPAAGGGA